MIARFALLLLSNLLFLSGSAVAAYNTSISYSPKNACNASAVQLNSFEVWQREAGFWIGNYSLYGPDGNPFTSAGWNYKYDHYMGFIHIELNGACLKQRNVFLYPPADELSCADRNPNVPGNGTCGVNGNEKVFAADQCASDCVGNLAGPFPAGSFVLDTETSVTFGRNDTVLYQVRLPAAAGGGLFQNQLTTVGANGTRIRTAQGINPATGLATFASFYRERRVPKDEWVTTLEQVRNKYRILEADVCGYDSLNVPTNVSCEEHFGFKF